MKVPQALAVVAAVSCTAVPVAAQSVSALESSVLVGPSSYDLSGTGTTFAVAGQVAYSPVRALYVEGGITYFEYTTQGNRRDRFAFPEISIQGAIPLGPVSPYVGVGGGFTIAHVLLTLHAVGGVRVRAGSRWGMRGELRVRAVDPWGASTADFMFGASRRF
jgi:hypothetical protein